MNWCRMRAPMAIVVVAVVSGGCPMYSPTRDKQWQAVQASWAQVDLKSQVEVPRKNPAYLLDERLAIEDQLWHDRRDRTASLLAAGMTVQSLTGDVHTRLVNLAGKEFTLTIG